MSNLNPPPWYSHIDPELGLFWLERQPSEDHLRACLEALTAAVMVLGERAGVEVPETVLRGVHAAAHASLHHPVESFTDNYARLTDVVARAIDEGQA